MLPDFRKRLLENPGELLLHDYGVEVPLGTRIEVLEEERDLMHVILPPRSNLATPFAPLAIWPFGKRKRKKTPKVPTTPKTPEGPDTPEEPESPDEPTSSDSSICVCRTHSSACVCDSEDPDDCRVS